MIDTPSAPKRWRWPVAVFLGAAVATVFWSSSQVDPRLVGRWQTAPQTFPWPHVVTFDFGRDGVVIEDSGIAGKTRNFWTVERDSIVIRPDRVMTASTLPGQFLQWAQENWSGAPAPPPPDAFRIVSITEKTLTLEYVGVRRWPAPTYVLTRVPE
ncbi:hypothetical protein Pan44_35670 [Caulifigura coniformis]|uniref:Uncharacterized protein n=1 Tax=Caulifigura coniformis TaxID=2527983 RepID=A0A517SHC0_9PLAN|nr:hypothetical protein [Caulifigura coniformis]QDT55523.1 hypothetical protein Pan44_35670 [Caulifigura coniformis]